MFSLFLVQGLIVILFFFLFTLYLTVFTVPVTLGKERRYLPKVKELMLRGRRWWWLISLAGKNDLGEEWRCATVFPFAYKTL